MGKKLKISLKGEQHGTPLRVIRWANAISSAVVAMAGFSFWFDCKPCAIVMLCVGFAAKTVSNFFMESKDGKD